MSGFIGRFSWLQRAASFGLLAIASLATGCAVYETPGRVSHQAPPWQGYPQSDPAGGAPAPQASGAPQVVRSIQVPQNTMPANGGLSVSEILTQFKGGKPQPELINDIRDRGLNAPLKQADVDLLAANGVPKEVVDAALAAPVNTVSVDQPTTVTRNYYHYPWVPFTLGLYWGSTWRPHYYPYYSYAPRAYYPGVVSPRYYGYSGPRYVAPAPVYRHSLPSGGGWGGGARGRWR